MDRHREPSLWKLHVPSNFAAGSIQKVALGELVSMVQAGIRDAIMHSISQTLLPFFKLHRKHSPRDGDSNNPNYVPEHKIIF